ncbi:MAG TPA: glycosyltransferase family 39 protein [Gemmatimonadales bacterium]|nr:glycosyltransferase family 39 protein [Gemmatimonadales bacterium]
MLGGTLRLLAAIFSQGFLASDDHHVVVGAADQIASGAGLPITYARSALFPGAIAAVMTITRTLGIHDPGIELMFVRLVQAAYSLLVVYFVYRILERSLGRDGAIAGGVLAAVFFAMPVTAVHQLEESVCQVPLLAACWWWQRCEVPVTHRSSIIWGASAGIGLGLALILRFPLIGFVAVFVAIAVLRPRPVTISSKVALLAGLLVIVLLQGYSNALINHEWWYSFKERLGPMLHPQRMAVDAEGYPHSPPWHYILTLLAAFIPPVSVLLLAAAVKGGSTRQFLLLGAATLAFLVSHSLIANKQERFLLPILPVLFIMIVAGLPWLAARMRHWDRAMWSYFWAVNAALLLVLTFSFAKKDRVAPLLYVYRRHDATGVLVAQYNETFTVPAYYLGRPGPLLAVVQRRDAAAFTARWVADTGSKINYVVLYSDTPAADRALLAGALRKNLTLLTSIAPSLADRIAHAINPRHNKARTAAVYTIT